MNSALKPDTVAALSTFVDDLRSRLGDSLLGVTMYGSAARGDFVEGVSDINLLILARELGAPTLRAAGVVVREWNDRLPLSPTFATTEFIASSSDVFPVEFLEMRDWHVVLHGPDPFTGLEEHRSNMRRQVEAEMKGKMLRLRTAYARAAGRPIAVVELVRDSLSTFRALFGGALRLQGVTPPARRSDLVREVARVYGVTDGALDEAVALKEDPLAQPGDADALFARYLAALEAIVEAVDAHLPGGPEPTAPV